tara:strand:+ start:816 stop:1133 length:318 start_codon:yes stop_codon:yes gene_type:complete
MIERKSIRPRALKGGIKYLDIYRDEVRLSPINSGEARKTHGVDRKAWRGRKTYQTINDYVGNPYIDCEKEVDVHEVTVSGGRVGVTGLELSLLRYSKFDGYCGAC